MVTKIDPTRRAWMASLLATGLLLAAGLAQARELTVLCAGAVKPALAELGPRWAAAQGHTLRVTYAPAGELRQRLAAGERPDLLILPSEGWAAVEAAGWSEPAQRRPLVAVGIGVAVRADAPALDIGSEAALRQALLQAPSITYMDPTRGTSGKHVHEVLLPALGIAQAVAPKVVLGQGGMIAEQVARGEVALALQQMSELLPVPGVRVLGPLPAALQKTTVYEGAPLRGAAGADEARALLAHLRSAEAAPMLAERGFLPVP